jgi:predicted exporter
VKQGTRTLWRIVVAALFAAMLAALCVLFLHARIQTDVFSLFSDSQSSDADRALMREVLTAQGKLLALRLDGPNAKADADRAAQILVDGGAAAAAHTAGAQSFADIGGALYRNRMILLFPRHLAHEKVLYAASGSAEPFEDWLAAQTVADMDTFLAQPQSIALSQLTPDDPFLLAASCMDAVPAGGSSGESAVVLADISGPATDARSQKNVLAALDRIRTEFAPEGMSVHATGAVLFANRSESLIRADVTRLNLIMTALLLALMLGVLRSFTSLLAVALPVAMAWTAAALAIFLFNDSVYALSLGIGGILGGIAIDYPIYIMLHRRTGEGDYLPTARRLLRPLAMGCLANVTVFSFLLFSGLPLMRQVGLFVAGGLLSCCLFVLPCYAAFPPCADPEAASKRLEHFDISGLRFGPIAATCALALMCLGMPLLHWGDAIDALQPPMPDLTREDAYVRATAGKSDASSYLVTFGSDPADALANAHATEKGDLAALLSTRDEVEAAAQWVDLHGAAFEKSLRAKLDASGYDSASFKPPFTSFPAPDAAQKAYMAALDQTARALPAGLGWMMGRTNTGAWIVSRRTDAAGATLTPPPPRSHRLDVRGQLQEAFRQYRSDAVRLSLFGFASASLIVLIPCGIRRGLRILAVPVLSVGATLGLLGLCDAGINLFHVVGLLMGYGLAMDYALFTYHPNTRRAPVRLSALTTIVGFAALATSTIPAVRGLGISVLLVIIFTLAQCELRPLWHCDESAR